MDFPRGDEPARTGRAGHGGRVVKARGLGWLGGEVEGFRQRGGGAAKEQEKREQWPDHDGCRSVLPLAREGKTQWGGCLPPWVTGPRSLGGQKSFMGLLALA